LHIAQLLTLTAAAALLIHTGSAAAASDRIQLELRPRVCTLSGNDQQCNTIVRAAWRSSQSESLCLVIAKRSDVKQCWENNSKGTYSVELMFSDDLLVELRDTELQTVLTSKAIKVIREVLEYRHKRRQPWSIIY
jgi:hypothetical protein